MAKVFNTENFDEEVTNAETLAMVDFWAPWCGPCRMIGPVIDELAESMDDVVIGKVNVDENPQLSAKFGVRGIPAILFFKGGEVVDRLVGVQSKAAMEGKIESLK